MKIDDGGPAFAAPSVFGDKEAVCHEHGEYGMDVRTWLAGQAMAAIIGKLPLEGRLEDSDDYDRVALGATRYADALIARLKAPAPKETP